jgi:spatacsin
VVTLEKLGEDIEFVLRHLLFGTVRRSLRLRIIDQMKRRGFLKLDDMRILERIMLIEVSFSSDISRVFFPFSSSLFLSIYYIYI